MSRFIRPFASSATRSLLKSQSHQQRLLSISIPRREINNHDLAIPFGTFNAETYKEDKANALKYLTENGWDFDSLTEVPIIWGQQDLFNHVNNVHYVRFFETGRANFYGSIVKGAKNSFVGDLDAKVEKGEGFILANVTVRYRRPVTYPDTLIVAHRPVSVGKDRFLLEHCCYSLKMQTIAAIGTVDTVTYDYEALQKTDISPRLKEALEKKLYVPKK